MGYSGNLTIMNYIKIIAKQNGLFFVMLTTKISNILGAAEYAYEHNLTREEVGQLMGGN